MFNLNWFIQNTLNHTTSNRFDYFVDMCQSQYDKPVNSLAEMRMRQNKKLRGDIFEEFCKRYLENHYSTPLKNVWLFSEVPQEVKEKLGLRNQDLGIDIIALDFKGRYYAVQVKYRKHNPHKQTQIIGWKQLSTFYALVYRSGPFHKHIVMTNVNGVRHITKKTSKDQSICKRRFQKMSYFDWKKMMDSGVDEGCVSSLTPEEVRQKRLEYYCKV